MKNIHLTLTDLQRVRDAAVIITQQLDHHITIPDLAGMVNIPEKKLKAGFQYLFQTGVYAFRQEYLWPQVQDMLLQDMPLKTIARGTGFNSMNALIRAFRRKFGVTPAHWKKQEENRMLEKSKL